MSVRSNAEQDIIANPDLVERLQSGAPLAAPCEQFFYTPDAEGYSDYPPLAG